MNIFNNPYIKYVADTIANHDTGMLDVHIELQPSILQAFSYGGDINTSDQSSQILSTSSSEQNQQLGGLSGHLAYSNRNILHSAVQWKLTLTGAVNVPLAHFFTPVDSLIYWDLGINNTFTFPGLLTPFNFSESELSQHAATAFSLNYLYEKNLDYQRTTFNTNVLYSFSQKNITYFLTPFEVSLVNARIVNDDFGNSIKELNNPLITDLFDKHIIADVRAAMQVNSQPQVWLKKPMSVFRVNLEEGGGLSGVESYIVNKATNDPDKQPGQLDGVKYYQYVRLELDYRYYRPLSSTQMIAFHTDAGIGSPFGSSTDLPFEKSFYVGGPNDIRAWHLRQLGPGSFTPQNTATGNLVSYDRAGDVKMENTLEYRFPFIGFIKSALFLDGGNVWLLHPESAWPGGQLPNSFNQFYQQYAVGTGVGFRLDFGYFIICLDLGLPLKDPSRPVYDGWIPYSLHAHDFLGQFQPVLNIGMGYPF